MTDSENCSSKKTGMNQALIALFSSFGKFLDLKFKRNLRHRGQAFVSYPTQELADKVMKELQSFDFFGKPLV
jgi:RNA recognition motif-containing protein